MRNYVYKIKQSFISWPIILKCFIISNSKGKELQDRSYVTTWSTMTRLWRNRCVPIRTPLHDLFITERNVITDRYCVVRGTLSNCKTRVIYHEMTTISILYDGINRYCVTNCYSFKRSTVWVFPWWQSLNQLVDRLSTASIYFEGDQQRFGKWEKRMTEKLCRW